MTFSVRSQLSPTTKGHIFDLYTTELEQHPLFLDGCRARRPELTKVAGRVKSKKAYDLVIETAKRLSVQVEAFNGPSSVGVNVEELAKHPDVEEPINAGNVPQVILLDPHLSQTKGRKRDGKVEDDEEDMQG
ncbi:hypothetical protein Dimus_004880 [Dionaea muscipula]